MIFEGVSILLFVDCDALNGVVVGYDADCYANDRGLKSRVNHGPFQKV
jgi:hypothetical protein